MNMWQQSYTVDKWIRVGESYVSRNSIEYIGIENTTVVIRTISGNKYVYATSESKQELRAELVDLLNRVTDTEHG